MTKSFLNKEASRLACRGSAIRSTAARINDFSAYTNSPLIAPLKVIFCDTLFTFDRARVLSEMPRSRTVREMR
ncbi:MAG: hypothetical protein M0R76_02675 [Proteobacteria bacterium]|nr:hypothetical protein [Pseudomonadota bacterium]